MCTEHYTSNVHVRNKRGARSSTNKTDDKNFIIPQQ